MESEAGHLRGRLDEAHEDLLSRWRRTRGRLASAPVDLIVSGIGLVNAAAATATLCLLERPRAILNYGCAGAHRDDLSPGDVVLGERVVHVSSQIILPSGERKYMGFLFHVNDVRTEAEAIAADPELLALARRAAEGCAMPSWPGERKVPRILVGPVASADVWTQHGESIHALHDLHGSLCEEMEAAAIAQVAAIHGVPFLAVKDISNNELRRPTEATARGWPSIDTLSPELGRRAALVVEAMVRAGVPAAR
jgi:adenosylhomocysteine nucleosidase